MTLLQEAQARLTRAVAKLDDYRDVNALAALAESWHYRNPAPAPARPADCYCSGIFSCDPCLRAAGIG